jgi:hypothetical protein
VAEEPKKRWGLGHLNNLKNIILVAPALTDITSNFTSPKPPIQSKSTCFHTQGTSVKMIEMGNQFYLPQYNIAIIQCIV